MIFCKFCCRGHAWMEVLNLNAGVNSLKPLWICILISLFFKKMYYSHFIRFCPFFRLYIGVTVESVFRNRNSNVYKFSLKSTKFI